MRRALEGCPGGLVPALVALSPLGSAQILAERSEGGELAAMEAVRGGVQWLPRVEYHRIVLTVSGEGRVIRREFGKEELLELKLGGGGAEALPDGAYSYELTRIPWIDPKIRKKLTEARESGDRSVVEKLRMAGLLPGGPMVQSGYFRVLRGRLVSVADRRH